MFAAFISFSFSIIFVSVFVSKILHLYIHGNAIPLLDLILYLPSLLLPDLVAISAARLLLRKEPGALAITGCIFGCIFAYVNPTPNRSAAQVFTAFLALNSGEYFLLTRL